MGQIAAIFIVAIVICFAAGLAATMVAASIGIWLDLLDRLAERRRRKARTPRRPIGDRNPFVSEFQRQINNALGLDGYRSINYPDPSPDRRPTNPFNRERIPNPPPREP